ncbi:MAG: tetratricopeptide repeat protein [Tannerella sp.]|jgi:tetratricopeptide (TPR) repeat protein|nr:tetratricopeptide repeat protein [Tannerella sp.]
MKIKVCLLLAAGSLLGMPAAFAQKGVDNGTRFGSGQDSVRCITNISLFVPYAKNGDYKDALPFWKIAYNECPAAIKDIYLYGVRIVGWEYDQATDPAQKAALMKDLLAVYDQRIKYFGNDPRYGTSWILAKKAQDYVTRLGDKADPKLVYAWTKEAVDKFGDKCDPLAISYYMFASNQLMVADPNQKANYIQDYLKCSAIYDAQLANASGKEKTVLQEMKTGLDNGFANSGAADCATLQKIYGPKVEANKTDLKWLKQTITLFRRMRCTETDAYYAAATYAYKIEPSAEAARGLARKDVRDKDYEGAIQLFQQSINMETVDTLKAQDNYAIAAMLFDQKKYSEARKYAQEAIKLQPTMGPAYILIGQMYASTAKSIYPNDPVLVKTVFIAAVDKFLKARQVDPSVADDANKLISAYSKYFPTKEEVFMHPKLGEGKAFTVGGWIGETVIVKGKQE